MAPAPSQGHALLGVAVTGVAGFLLHAGPIYRGRGAATLAAQPVGTWVGCGGLALLLAGLLAVPARAAERRRQRDIVAVLSILGTLAVTLGIVDTPAGTTVGWALSVAAVLAVVQSVLAVVAALSATPHPRSPAQYEPPPRSPDPYAPTGDPPPTYYGSGSPGLGAVAGESHHVGHTAHREPRAAPVFTPMASPAATGAQPARTTGSGHRDSWGGRAEPAVGHRDETGEHTPRGFTPGQ